MHIISKWGGKDAIKVLTKSVIPEGGKWMHIAATYDGSGKAAGIRIYINGKPEVLEVAADSLKSSIKTKMPFKIAQRVRARG